MFGCTGFWELLRELRSRHRRTLRRDELGEAMETALERSPIIGSIRESVQSNTVRLEHIDAWRESHEDETHRHRLIGLREAMMRDPTDRLSHEHMLLAGEEYLASGGNGIGKTRYEILKADYERRIRAQNWNYNKTQQQPPNQ